ncbi:MAG: hypothetical protein CM1200mP10_10690 [Candidatus Neomarinimicrobiota bacterium]|nr:MAG: hypothetical protein CM1200mP10_10690 [Candidatus Neomarinimicrobiota bacterium]
MDTTSTGADTTLYDTSAAVLFTAHAGTRRLRFRDYPLVAVQIWKIMRFLLLPILTQ